MCAQAHTICIHDDNANQNMPLPTHSQTDTHPPRLSLSHSPHCFEHSWPLCFTYLSLSAVVELWSVMQLGLAYTQLCLWTLRTIPTDSLHPQHLRMTD